MKKTNETNTNNQKNNTLLRVLNIAYKIFVPVAIIIAIILLLFYPCHCPCAG